MIFSVFPSGCWQVNLTLPYPDANDVTPLYPFTVFGFGGDSVQVMNFDRSLEMCVVHPQLINQSLDQPLELATIK
jgi:hypothetical protein